MKDLLTNTETVKPESLSNRDLELYGRAHFADIDYRLAVGKRLSNHLGADKAVLFDDVAYAVPENQRHKLHGLPGYERALFPGLLLAPSFENGVTVLVGAPPNPAELKGIKYFKSLLEAEIGKPIDYRIFFEQNGQLVDILEAEDSDPSQYLKICQIYADRMNDLEEVNKIKPDYHMQLYKRHQEELSSGSKTLVWPFQVTQDHIDLFANEVNRGDIILPNYPEIDKAFNNYLLRKNGFEHVPDMIVVNTKGRIIETFEELEDYREKSKNNDPIIKNPHATRNFAEGIILAMDKILSKGKKPYIKLDSNGVSGLTNIDPEILPQLYVQDESTPTRINTLAEFIFENLDNGPLPQFAVVEEYVQAKQIEGVPWDGTVCGMMIDGQFYPQSINPFLTEHGEYVSQWNGTKAENLGESNDAWQKMFGIFSEMGKILSQQTGYRNGILAGDVFQAEDGRFLVHDFNFRRGGRTTPEVMIALDNGGWFENQIIIPLPEDAAKTLRGADIFNLYNSVCHRLIEDYGMMPFATAFGYFAHKNGDVGLKFKTMTKTEFFGDEPRNKHRAIVSAVITALLAEELNQYDHS